MQTNRKDVDNMLIDKEIKTRWSGSNKRHFIEKGYIFTKIGDEIIVKTEDLKDKSSIKVKVKCDCCGIEKNIKYYVYTNSLKQHNGIYLCKYCNGKKKAKYSIKDIKEYLYNFNYELIDDMGYHKVNDKIKIKCDKGHIYTTEFNVVLQGCKCPHCYKLSKFGEGNPRYNPNLTDEQRQANISRHSDLNYRRWIKDVFKRDNYTCKCCGKRGANLNAHHLDGYDNFIDKRLDIDNGITLCEKCHKNFHSIYGYGNNTKEQFEEFLNNNLLYVNTEVSG